MSLGKLGFTRDMREAATGFRWVGFTDVPGARRKLVIPAQAGMTTVGARRPSAA